MARSSSSQEVPKPAPLPIDHAQKKARLSPLGQWTRRAVSVGYGWFWHPRNGAPGRPVSPAVTR